MTFGRKPLERAPRAPVTPSRSIHRGTYKRADEAPAVQSDYTPAPKRRPKAKIVRDQRIRDSANGEDCLVRLPGCPHDPQRTIWSHYRGSAGGKGLALKSSDRAGAYACTYCDGIYDGQTPRPPHWTDRDVRLAWLEGHIRSILRLEEKGLL